MHRVPWHLGKALWVVGPGGRQSGEGASLSCLSAVRVPVPWRVVGPL